MNQCEIAVIGGGAAGLTAAIFAAESAQRRAMGVRIVVLDGAARIGAKILVSGGGRCNVTHREVRPEDFNGSRHIVRNILAAFDVAATCRWFESMGVRLKCEATGKMFPVSDSARTVVAALLQRCRERNVAILTGHRVHAVRAYQPGFVVHHTAGTLRAGRVIMATGGRSLPRTGSDGGGWTIARSLGHSVTATYPALVPLVLDASLFHAELSGLSQPVELSTFADGKLIDRRTGSMLWTHFGVSGPVVMDASRHWTSARGAGALVEMRCNFLPGESFDGTAQWLTHTAAQRPRLSIGRCLMQKLPERLGAALADRAGCHPTMPLGQLTRSQRRALVHALVALPLPIQRERGWNHAEVTAGGVPLEEIDYRTMESRKLCGLYLVGEMLDCDGRIGGFNFQWAWATGYVAGRAAGTAASHSDTSMQRAG
jgi:predicted Rossmann fold flavoprotein